jgi:hypothetical protein
MIHLLEISPEISVQTTKKLARRYAMTGGYEICLKNDLTTQQLADLVQLYKLEIKSFSKINSHIKNSLAFRILKLVSLHSLTDRAIREELRSLLDIN